jgi:hypothetical protein
MVAKTSKPTYSWKGYNKWEKNENARQWDSGRESEGLKTSQHFRLEEKYTIISLLMFGEIYTYIYIICMYVFVYMYAHTHVYAHTHTHAHTHWVLF